MVEVDFVAVVEEVAETTEDDVTGAMIVEVGIVEVLVEDVVGMVIDPTVDQTETLLPGVKVIEVTYVIIATSPVILLEIVQIKP